MSKRASTEQCGSRTAGPGRSPGRSAPEKQRGLGLSSCAVPSHTPGAQFRRTKIIERKQVSGEVRSQNPS
jgi:hypothetical protein